MAFRFPRLSLLHAALFALFWMSCAVYLSGCGRVRVRTMTVTAYCGCGKCCSWTRGSWKYLKLDVWNRYVAAGPSQGAPYTGRTASGTRPCQAQPGLFSLDSLKRPIMIPFRLAFPWCWLPEKGTLAADTNYYPFGTKIYVPGYGWGVVEDRGSAIKGPDRLDLYFRSHRAALEWGNRQAEATIRASD